MASGATRAREALKLYNFPKYNFLNDEGAHLPESYKKFFREWKYEKPLPVHYRPAGIKWFRDDVTGEVKRIEDYPIRVLYPPESHIGIWGGEGIVKGFTKKKGHYKSRIPHFWIPHLKISAVYSEVLNKRMKVTVTDRTIDLIIQHNGFDNYLLQNKACDLQSRLALRLKQKILHTLYYKTLYPDNPTKMEEVYQKYKHFLDGYSAEDIDWYGLSFMEAIKKFEELNNEKNIPVPLKHELRISFIQKLMNQKVQEEQEKKEETKSWIKKLNPFSK